MSFEWPARDVRGSDAGTALCKYRRDLCTERNKIPELRRHQHTVLLDSRAGFGPGEYLEIVLTYDILFVLTCLV